MLKKSIPMITYVKNGKKKTILVWNKNRITNLLYRSPFSKYELLDQYTILDDIESIHFHNITFDCSVYFHCSNNTNLILDHCYFEQNRIIIRKGNIHLIYPHFSGYYIPYINIMKAKTLNIQLDSKAGAFCQFYLHATASITLDAGAEPVREIRIIEPPRNNEIPQTELPAYISLKNLREIEILNITAQKKINIIDSDIQSRSGINTTVLSAEMIHLKNSSIESESSLIVECQKIETDTDSTLKSLGNIKLLHDVYKNKNYSQKLLVLHTRDLTANRKPKELLEQRRRLISIWKGLREQIIQEINTQITEKERVVLSTFQEEQRTLEQIQKEKQNLLEEKKGKSLIKVKEYQTELQNRAIKNYNHNKK